MTVTVLEVEVGTAGTTFAHVTCKEPVDLSEERRLRKMLEAYYQRKNPTFSRIALQVQGSTLLFRAIPNCKPSPTPEEVKEVLAIGLDLVPEEPDRKSRRPNGRPLTTKPAARREARI